MTRSGESILEISIEEYDTGTGWFVRKWSTGYIEQTYTIQKKMPTSGWTAYGGVVGIDLFTSIVSLPVQLTSFVSYHYCVQIDYSKSSNAYGAWLTPVSRVNPLTSIPSYAVYRATSPSSSIVTYWNIITTVTGYWK